MAKGACNHCTRVRELHNGLCNECAAHLGASTPGGNIFGFDFDSRPTCPCCNGTGSVSNGGIIFHEMIKCEKCHGTGKL